MKTYNSVISLLQSEMLGYEIGSSFFSNKRKELTDKEKKEDFIKSVIKDKNKTLLYKTDLLFNSSRTLPILYLRSLEDEQVESIIRENYELIKRSDVDTLYRMGEIIHITLPNGEMVLMDLGSYLFEDDLPGASIRGHGFLVDSELNILRDMRYYTLNFDMSEVRLATDKEKNLYSVVSIFERIDREYGEFAKDDMIYLVDEERFDFVNDRDTDKLLEGMLEEKVNLVFTLGDLKYCASEYGLQVPKIDYQDEW